MKNDDALKLMLLLMIGNQLEGLKEQLEDTDYHEYPVFDDKICALLDAVYASVKDSDKMIKDYITDIGLGDKLMSAIEGKNEE